VSRSKTERIGDVIRPEMMSRKHVNIGEKDISNDSNDDELKI
jgi:hypothetical protein